MDWLVIVIVGLFMLGQTVSNINTKKKITQALEIRPESLAKMLDAPKPENKHRLIRTWIVSSRDLQIPAGWRWKCSCTVWGVAGNAVMNVDLGTEQEAIEGWKKHAQSYLDANRNEYKELYEKTEAEFAEYREKCYCKDANPELLPWKE